MRRSRMDVTVTEVWIDPASLAANCAECGQCGTCGKCDTGSDNSPALTGKTANAERSGRDVAHLPQSPAKAAKVPFASDALAAKPGMRRLRQATLSSLLCEEKLKEGIIDALGLVDAISSGPLEVIREDITTRALEEEPFRPPSRPPLRQCNECLFGDPPAPPADTRMGWHRCVAGKDSGFGNALRRCDAWMPLPDSDSPAQEPSP